MYDKDRMIPCKITYDFGKPEKKSLTTLMTEAVITERAMTELHNEGRLTTVQITALHDLRAMINRYKEHICPK